MRTILPSTLRLLQRSAKELYDLNQYTKNLYDMYFIVQGGTLVGRAVKEKFKHSYYHTEIWKRHPQILNCLLNPKTIYDAYRDKHKPDLIDMENGVLKYKEGTENSWDIGTPFDIDVLERRAAQAVEELGQIVCHADAEREFSREEIQQLIGYERIFPMFLDDPRFLMILAISEFPLLKKWKHLKAYMKDYPDKNYFDVVFITYSNSGERFSVLRRFVKLG